MEMAPEDAETIRNTTVNLVREVEASGGFYLRPKAQLKQLEAKLRDWSADDAILATIREEVLTICARHEDTESTGSACQNFLTPA